ncbi:2'-5' RNA ligase family protein [Gordonia alkaliphila]|uniref:2'-5' RNA ligase family protein n=1 Tax=Gordonia alkaliphila TaxID=1053547 RepID=A0ABP8Z648_9ACTN
MAHSLELLPGPETDAVLRAAWDRLAAAGLRAVRRPASPTDRPHCTLIAAPRIASDVDALLPELATHLPLAAHLGPPVALPGRGRYTLAVAVVPNAALLALHAQAAAALDAYATQTFGHTRPGRWTAHMTLARRLTGDQVGAALELLDRTDQPVAFTAIRRWDGDAARDVVVEAPF